MKGTFGTIKILNHTLTPTLPNESGLSSEGFLIKILHWVLALPMFVFRLVRIKLRLTILNSRTEVNTKIARLRDADAVKSPFNTCLMSSYFSLFRMTMI